MNIPSCSARVAQVVIGFTNHFYPGHLPKIIHKRRYLILYVGGVKRKYQFLIFIKAQVFLFYIRQLTINNNDGCDQRNSQDKLKYHEGPSNSSRRNMTGKIALYDLDRPELRKIESRVTACYESRKDCECCHRQPEPIIRQKPEADISLGNMV